jgi:uncharacterized protein (DUF433 family)
MTASEIVTKNPDILGGAPVFIGTRVPVGTLLDYLETGSTLQNFLADFPTVTQDQAIGLLEALRSEIIGSNEAAA